MRHAPLAHPPIYLRPDAIEADSNISAVHATDFGSSLCKSRITPPTPQPTLKNLPSDPHEYLSIQPIMFSGGFYVAQIPARGIERDPCVNGPLSRETPFHSGHTNRSAKLGFVDYLLRVAN